MQRRNLLSGSLALAAGGALLKPSTAVGDDHETASLGDGSVILFQGDSITDAGRNRKDTSANHPRGLGNGYPRVVAGELLRAHPSKQLKIINRGISGNKVPDLDRRWQEDCLELKPDVLSILIGVNDIWHKLNGRYDGTVESYETGLAALLQRTASELPNTRLVICEPFVLRCGAVNDSWFPEFDQRRAACKRVAKSAGTDWVPFQSMFDKACESAPPAYWAADGVHPSIAGHALMAQTWREVVGV